MLIRTPFYIHILPRQMWTWEQFCAQSPPGSIALDGMVFGGPRMDETQRRINFDHHDGVVREATMSTAMQVYFAIKGGLMSMMGEGHAPVHVYVNDTDQDTSLAVWLLLHYKLFEGTQSVPHVQRLLTLTDRMDITGGAFPMNLDDRLLATHAWVFEPYASLRKSGELARAGVEVLQSNLEALLARLDRFLMNEASQVELDTRHEILFDDPRFKIVDEIGGNDARYFLFAHGMNAFIALVARRPDGRFVYTVGRRSRYIPFPVNRLYAAYNKAEDMPPGRGFNGSDIVGGSDRELGSALTWEQIRDITLAELA